MDSSLLRIHREAEKIPKNGWSTEELFTILQKISGNAVAETHATGADLKKLGLMWVVIRYDIQLVRALCPGETIRFETWAEAFRHRMSQRNYLAYDSDGNTVLSGAGIWAVADRTSRSMVDAGVYGVVFPIETDRLSLPKPAVPDRLDRLTVKTLSYSGQQPEMVNVSRSTGCYTVVPDDLDMNGHMNNTRYFSVAEHCIPDGYKPAFLKRARASFHSEALLGEELALVWEIQNREEVLKLSLEAETEGKERFRMTLEYADDKSVFSGLEHR